MFVNNQHGIQRRVQVDEKFVFEGVQSKEGLSGEFPEKSWTKPGFYKLLKKLRDAGTVDTEPEI